MSPSLKKSKEKAAIETAKAKRHEENKAWSRLKQEEEAVIERQKEYLQSMEATIMAEVEASYQKYLSEEEDRIQREENKKNADLAARRESAVTSRRESFPLFMNNEGAKNVLNEEVLENKEKYKILRQDLGRGKYGIVYRAQDPVGRDIACKVNTFKSLPSDYKARILKSLGIQRFLKDHPHPNLMVIFDIFMTPDKLYIFCQAMNTDLLKKIKKEAPLPESEALGIGKDVAQGLAYLHSLGVAHERIRPGHVLLDESGTAKICGFGWTSVFFDPESGALIQQKGNKKQKFHHFFAPEVMKDASFDASVADIWSLGTLINIMLTKEWPFEEKNSYDRSIMWKLSFKKSGVELSDTVYNILDMCYTEDPKKRPDIFTILSALPTDISRE